MSALGAAGYTPVGYEMCPCGAIFVEGTRRTGRCQDCDTAVATLNSSDVVVRIDGSDVTRKALTKRRSRSKPSPAAREARRAFNRARSRAYSELARRHPDEYAALLEHFQRADEATV